MDSESSGSRSMMQSDDYYNQQLMISAPSSQSSQHVPNAEFSTPSSSQGYSYSSPDQHLRGLSQGSHTSSLSPGHKSLPSPGSKRPAASTEVLPDLAPPSPKRAGLECTVRVEKDDQKTGSPSTSKEGSEKAETKSEKGSPSPRKGKLEREDSAMLAEKEAQRLKRMKQEEDRMRMKVLVSNFTEDQLDRYEMFRRAAFPKAAVRRLMQSISGSTISQNVVIAMAGIAKVFVGEIVEEALDVMEKYKETGPIQPKHIREAVRRVRTQGMLVNTKYKKKLFR